MSRRVFLHLFLTLVATATGLVAAEAPVWQGEAYGGMAHLVTVDDCRAFVILPKKPDPARARAWTWYAPVVPGYPNRRAQWLFTELLAQGVAVAGIDVGDNYANPEARRRFWKFYEQVRAQFALGPQACLLAQSRGGLNHYLFAAEHPEAVRCIAGIYPVMNLRSYPGIPRAAKAYGMSERAFESALAKHNPIDNLGPLARAHVSLFHLHGDSDKLVPLADNTAIAADRYRALGGEIQVVVVPGKGHEEVAEFFESRALLDFLLRHAAAK